MLKGCDHHPSVPQIAWVDTETGGCEKRRLTHRAEAEQFYLELRKQVRAGIEATGHSRWFERLLAELNFELWIGDPAQIRAKRVRKQKTNRRDAEHILKLMLKDGFPRIWAPTPENRNLRQLLWHRHRLVGMRTRVMNQLQAVAMNEGIRRKKGLWSEGPATARVAVANAPTARRRQELLALLDQLDPNIDELSQAIEQEAEQVPEVKLLMTHPGVGPITALAFVLVLGTPARLVAASRWLAIWDWFLARTPAPTAGDSVTSRIKAIRRDVTSTMLCEAGTRIRYNVISLRERADWAARTWGLKRRGLGWSY